MCKLVVINSTRTFVPLIGRSWLDVLFPDWRKNFISAKQIMLVQNELDTNDIDNNGITENKEKMMEYVQKLDKKYPKVFSSKNQCPIKDFKVDIQLTENAKPIFCKPYTVPYGLRERELKRN